MNSRDYYIFLLQYFWFAVIPDSEGHILTLTRTSCPRTVTPVTLGSYPRLMHIRSLNKTFGIGHMTWRSFPEIIATHKRLPPRHRLTWPLNRSPKIRGLKQAVNSKSNQFNFLEILTSKKKTSEKNKQTKTGGFDVNCTLSLILIDKSQYQHLQTGLFSFLAVDRFPACSGFTRPDIARHGSPQEGTYLY